MATFSTKNFTKHDDYMTPKSAWTAIEHLLPKDKVIWECFYGDGKSGEYLRQLGFKVIHQSYIDFFKNNLGDVIVSNPPFTKKKEVLERLVELDKPFIMIMPVSTITTQYCRRLFKDKKLQILIPSRRIQFGKTVDGKPVESSGCNFDCFYFCYKWNLQNDITYLN